jgi:hypothetical protein
MWHSISKIYGYEIADFGSSVLNDTAVAKKDPELIPIVFWGFYFHFTGF